MRWTTKARVQRVCSRLPWGDRFYVQIQRRFGNVEPDPTQRIGYHVRMMRMLRGAGFDIRGARAFEVGSGHYPTLPLLFHLAGAQEVVTVDLHRRLRWADVVQLMRRLAEIGDDLVKQYEGLVDPVGLTARLELMARSADTPEKFFAHAGIRYVAPADAGAMPDAEGTYDLHFSATVMEHVEPRALDQIVHEAARLLRSGGLACHIIDPSDHYAHGDPTISRVNFLRFTERQWDKVAGNQFAYHNRLRSPEFLDVFRNAGLRLLTTQETVDQRSLTEASADFPLDQAFRRFTPEELATSTIDLLAVRD